MRPGFWMHENGMDVCIEVKRVQYSDSKRLKLKVLWWNLGYSGNPFLIYYNEQKVEILKKDLHKWHGISGKVFQKRTSPGLPK